jgi:hypothetical protein
MRGITIVGNTVWGACTAADAVTQTLVGFDIATGAVTNTIVIPNGDFINDVTAGASGIIYLSDNSNIYRVDTSAGTFTTLLTSAYAFNGLYFDEANNRLLYTDDSPQGSAQISAMDMSDNSTSVLFASPAGIQYCDGLTMDQYGNIYYSVWSEPNQVMRYNPNTGIVDVASTGHNGVAHDGAADIFYHDLSSATGKVRSTMSSVGTLIVPNMNANTVDFIPFDQLDSENERSSTPTRISLHQNFPNPFNPSTNIEYELGKENFVNITVYDLLGSEIVQLVNQIEQPGIKTVRWNGRDKQGNLVNGGVYVYRLSAGNYTETKKMIFLK